MRESDWSSDVCSSDLGDSLMIAVTGVYLGFWNVLYLLVWAYVLAAVFAGYVLIRKGFQKDAAFPFVPFLLAAPPSYSDTRFSGKSLSPCEGSMGKLWSPAILLKCRTEFLMQTKDSRFPLPEVPQLYW